MTQSSFDQTFDSSTCCLFYLCIPCLDTEMINALLPYAIYKLDTVINQIRFLESLYSLMYKNRQSTISKDFFSLFS